MCPEGQERNERKIQNIDIAIEKKSQHQCDTSRLQIHLDKLK